MHYNISFAISLLSESITEFLSQSQDSSYYKYIFVKQRNHNCVLVSRQEAIILNIVILIK